MSSFIQRSLSGGEIDPILWARSDTSKYMSGLRTLRNAYVRRNGGVNMKPGSSKIQAVKNSAKNVRLIPFMYSQSVTYMMELGDKYIRFYQAGAPYLVGQFLIAAYNSGTAYSNGAVVSSGGVNYMCTANAPSGAAIGFNTNPTLFGQSVTTITGQAPASNPGFWYALSGTTYEIPTPWAYTDLPNLRFDQTANDMIFTHPSYPPMRLSRVFIPPADTFQLFLVQNTSYMLPALSFTNNGSSPNTFTVGASGVITYGVSAVSASGDEYPLKGTETPGSGITTTKTVSTPTVPLELIWLPVPNAVSYNVYVRNENGVYGFLGSTATTTYFDPGGTPDFSNPWTLSAVNLFGASNNYPTACAFYQQRLLYANTNTLPTTTWGSQTGLYDNFDISVPGVDTDSFSFKMTGQQDVIQHLLSLGTLLVFTYGTINSVQGDQSGAISPSAINPHRESVHGASFLRPLLVGDNALYCQAQGAIIRDIGFNFQVDGYRGDDITVFATHLFDNYTLVDWAYQSVPNSIVWAVRSDGTLLSLTYVKEQQILAWSHHDTAAGFYENVACVPEGNQVSVYVVTNRVINGSTVRFVERLFNQQFTDVRNYIGMDCATTFDGRNRSFDLNITPNDTATLSGGTLWNETELLTLTLSGNQFHTFVTADVTNSNYIFLYDAANNLVRFKITARSSNTVVQGFTDRTVPVDLQGVATVTWSFASAVLTGLDYLDGQAVSVFADGCVVGSPNNPAYPVYTVSSGTITLDKAYAVAQVGLPFVSDIETLDIDTPGMMENMGGKLKLVGEVTLYMVNSRSVFVGGQNPDTDLTNTPYNPVFRLSEQKLRQYENYDSPMALQTGKVTQVIQPDWDANGHVFIRNVDPSPCIIAAISPDGLVPMRGA